MQVLFPPTHLSVNFSYLHVVYISPNQTPPSHFCSSPLKCLQFICQLIAPNIIPDTKGQSNSLLHRIETSECKTAKWHCLLSLYPAHARNSSLGSHFQEDFDAYSALTHEPAKRHLHRYGVRDMRLFLSQIF